MTAGLQLRAPGIYPAPAPVDRSFRPVRLDVAGFAGVAPKGPVDTPVLVRRWSDYLFQFGGFSGPGLLPYAVSAFFDQGGERAWVVRVAPRTGAAGATARHQLPGPVTVAGPVWFAAANEGAWGNGLRLRLEFGVSQQFTTAVTTADGDGQAAAGLELPDGTDVPVGSLLRVRGPGLPAVGAFRWVTALPRREVAPGRRRYVAVLDRPLDADRRWAVAVVTATLAVEDPDPDLPRAERLTDLGLDPLHPRFLARVVAEQSLLVTPVGSWVEERLTPAGPLLPTATSKLADADGGRDRYQEIDGSCFFDGPPDDPPDPDPLDERSHHGADRLAREDEIGLLAIPDLYWNGVDAETVELVETPEAPPGPSFGPCPSPPVTTVIRRPARQTLLDPRAPDELTELLARQRHLVQLAERQRRFVVLLDVPQKLAVRAIAQWRAGFDSSYAAAYHPWLSVTRTVLGLAGAATSQRKDVPPSAFAAGIIAARERRLGLSFGPANELAQGAVLALDLVSDDDHDVLHQLGVNVYRAERDGFRLTAARTLSRDRDLRQLSVRRLLTMLKLVLERQAQWVVFEPNTPDVRELLRNGIVLLLSGLYQRGAFAGNSEEESFFVRADDNLNPRGLLEQGRLVVEVGVAPAQPLEFLILRISRDGDGGVRVEVEDHGR
ncbi:MAG TPA: phage tail sheath C-terminal domain-containing protein [Actinomycetes bacterium]|nr:phage tail sheath C-terminal domain-containing protein [Actinomycetes bacterium]